MAKTEGDQEIPSWLLELYMAALGPATGLLNMVRKRYPWRLPTWDGGFWGPDVGFRGVSPNVSPAQLQQRAEFKAAVDCFNCAPWSGGAVPDDWGPRSRQFWYEQAIGSGLWYFDFFMRDTIFGQQGGYTVDWCKEHMTGLGISSIGDVNPDFVYDAECYVRAYNSGGNQWIGFGHCPPHTLPYCKIAIAPKDISTKGTTMTLRVWRVDGDWDDHTLTWNNHPPICEQLSATKLWWPAVTLKSYADWLPPRSEIRIPVPVGINTFAFKLETSPEIAILLHRWDCGNYKGYVLMSP